MLNPFSIIIRIISKYTGFRKKKLEIKKLALEIADNLKDFRGLDYIKIKFGGVLTDYQWNIILKIIEFVNDFKTNEKHLETYWLSYKLPSPINPKGFGELLRAIDNHSYFCIQDDKGKKYVDYFHHRHYTPSLFMNEYIRAADDAIAKYRSYPCITADNCSELSYSLSLMLILINNVIFQFYLNNEFELGKEPSFEESKTFFPNRFFLNNAKELHADITAVTEMEKMKLKVFPKKSLEAINAHLLRLRYICAFSALCGLMLDAVAGTNEFFDPLRHIENFLRLFFHDAELYRLELPASPVDTTIAIGSRNSQAHTTIMKLFLIDKDEHRVMLRIDLPHIRENKFHFNVLSPDEKKYNSLNHTEIEAYKHDDSLIQVLDILKTSIKEQIPNLYIVQDTNKKDEKEILRDMEKLITYRHMCLDYLNGKDYRKHQKKIAGFLHRPDASIEALIEEAAMYYPV